MRKSIFAFVALLTASFASAQITLLHTFNGNITFRTIDYEQQSSYPYCLNGQGYSNSPAYIDYSYEELYRQGRWYTEKIENNSCILTFWDDDFQPAGTKTITFPNIENYEVSSTFSLNAYTCTAKCFNDDDEAEYLVEYKLTNEYKSGKNRNQYENINTRLLIVKQNGTILHDFCTGYWISSNAYLYYLNNKWLYIIRKQYYDSQTQNNYYQTEVYQINKQSPLGLTQVSARHMLAYPNPTSSLLNIPIDSQNGTSIVNIYDMNGHLIETKIGDNSEEFINVNVSNYPAGSYIYQSGSNIDQFIKQ